MKQTRRAFLGQALLAGGAALAAQTARAKTFDEQWREEMRERGWAPGPISRASHAGESGPAVYFTREVSAAALQKAYAALGVTLPGKIGAKVSTGEPGGHHFLDPQLLKPLVQQLDANIVECNTAYGGRRTNLADHIRAALEHGWCDIATVDIMDGLATLTLPAPKGAKRLPHNIVGSHFRNYDSFLVLSHFKGHAMGGFGGALKNLSIGFASRTGKCLIHTGGVTDQTWMGGDQTAFLEAMAEAATAICQARPGRMAFINVMNHLSVDCDCASHPATPTMGDIGLLASLDPVAIDQACVDLVYAAHDSADLIERMESRYGIHTIEHAAALGLGSRTYRLIQL